MSHSRSKCKATSLTSMTSAFRNFASLCDCVATSSTKSSAKCNRAVFTSSSNVSPGAHSLIICSNASREIACASFPFSPPFSSSASNFAWRSFCLSRAASANLSCASCISLIFCASFCALFAGLLGAASGADLSGISDDMMNVCIKQFKCVIVVSLFFLSRANEWGPAKVPESKKKRARLEAAATD